MSGYERFLVPYDFSVHAHHALSTAVDLAQRLGAAVEVVHVVQPPQLLYGSAAYGAAVELPPMVDIASIHASIRKSLGAAVEEIADAPDEIRCHVVEGTGIADAICESAEKLGADLIVMGTHGRTGLAHVFLGSVAERTLRNARCPVLVVQADAADEDEKGASR